MPNQNTIKTKILIVDDHPAIRTTMSDVMESEGFDVELAENGNKAIELYADKTFDFVLIDMQMPDIKGVEAYKEMLQVDKRHARFIFISAFSAPELEKEAHELGCIAFFHKPIRVEHIIELIRSRLRISVLIFIENQQLRKRVTSEIKQEGFNFENSDGLDDALIRIRQIDYNFLIIDEDSPSLEQERIKNTIKFSNSKSEIVEINEDEASCLASSRIHQKLNTNYSI